ncbi:sucrose phosphorylase [Alkalibacterium sp. 20]|uniref:sucrose phosphorylase n=1 Tax=Alkalibacterium sp. 20 TaxID=1798803 RepID=UPI0009000A3E|nr:sucrose phosphorylase [Alkalibacterium sp. 20]OJF92771.1 sucrose phosphorylase [Alkalibacterium sp. 20]
MEIQNKVMLITYSDSLGKDFKELTDILDGHFEKAIGGIHLLPFFPSTGDRGFAPSDYTVVDPEFGTWQAVEELGEKYYLMFDFMINHISRESTFFRDYKKKHVSSIYKDMFIEISEFFKDGGPTKEDIDLIYKRKDVAPFQEVEFNDGGKEKVWNTFGEEQIDLDVTKEVTKDFIRDTIKDMASHGCSLIRLDAFAYAIKKLNTNCFFVEPEIWELLDEVKSEAAKYQIEVLPEIHEHYSIQMKIADHDYYIYDFALPMVVLYSIYSGKTNRLASWLAKSPMKQFTTLDTHDGIGVVDAKDILSDEELSYTSDKLYDVGANVKKVYSSESYNNLDIYQINTTYFSALGNEDESYLLARAIQIFAPGIPQVYYVGLLAGENDIKLLESTKEGRNINRHYYSKDEVQDEMSRPVVRKLKELLEFRNVTKAFDLEGSIITETPSESEIIITRESKDKESIAILKADFKAREFTITENNTLIFQ